MKTIIPFLLLAFIACSCGSPRKSSGYTIGIDPSWYPLQIAGQEKNILAFSIELLVEIAKKEELELAIQNMSWDNLMWGLREKRYDAVLSSMRPYTFYLSNYSFSDPYLMTGPVLVVPKKGKLHKLDQLKGKEVGVVRGSSAALLLQTTPGIILQSYSSIPEALDGVEKQDVDAAVVEVLIAQNFVRDIYSNTFKIASSPLNNEGLRLISLLNRNPDLMKRFDKGLSALKKDDTYDRLLEKWGLSPDGKPTADLSYQADIFIQDFLK